MDKTSLLLEAAEILNSDLKVKPLLTNILNITLDYLNAKAASVFLFNEKREQLDLYLMAGENRPEIWASHLKKGQGIAGWVVENGTPVLANDARSDPRFYKGIENMADFKTGALLCVPIKRHEKILGVVEALNPQGGKLFTDDDLEIMMALSGQMAVSLENAILMEKYEKHSREMQRLSEISMKLNTFVTLEEILDAILDSLSDVIDYDIAVIFIIDPTTGILIPQVEKSKNTGEIEMLHDKFNLKIGDGLVGWACKSGESIRVDDVNVDSRYVKLKDSTRSELVVPFKNDNVVSGVINVESDGINKYDDEDLRLLEAFSSQAAVAIERAHNHNEILKNRKLEDELKIAKRIQLTFLPAEQPDIPGYSIHGINHSYTEVGGDYYDFIPIVKGQTGIAIGDVAGHGIPAALIMAAFRASLKAEIRNNFAIRHILFKVNNLLCESVERGNYVTALYGVLDADNSIFTFSNAGHNPPLLLRVSGEVEELSEGGIALGVIPDAKYVEKPVILNAGDIIVFYTDGITETFNSGGEEFGTKKLVDCIKSFSGSRSEDISKSLIERLKVFRKGGTQTDDYTSVILKKI
ncbi:MAG: SpoIIE family protein phosphatase [candidate division Zixibacteria bacterium]|nr:SpoIIE family protein phosphatase [candidate division Zixibacteria bacterium]